MKQNLPIAFAKKLLIFYEQKEVNSSHFSNSNTFQHFLENVFEKRQTGKRRYKVVCNINRLEQYLKNHCEINDLKAYANINENTTRSEATQIASNSKATKKKVFQGIWFNTFQDIPAKLKGENINLKPTKGSITFFTEFDDLEIDKDIIIVGVENAENFTNIVLQQYLFDINKRYLFTFRDTKQDIALKKWLLSIENAYLHFGDFDLAGIAIFENQFRKFLDERASFFIPDDLEPFFEGFGNKDLYDKQFAQYPNLKGNTIETKQLLELIHKTQKGVEQEILIREN
jgi:hypothetical protein